MQDAMGNTLVSKDDLIRAYIPEDAERIIKNNEAQDKSKIIMELIQNNEMVQEVISQALQQQGAEGADVEIEN